MPHPPTIDSLRDLVLDALAACSGVDRSTLAGSTRLLDLDVDSLALASIVSLAEAASGETFDVENVARVLAAHDVDSLVATLVAALFGPRSPSA